LAKFKQGFTLRSLIKEDNMTISAQIAKHIRDVHFGGNWTSVNLKATLSGVTWQQATSQVHGFNTLATLLFHVNYYVGIQVKVLQGGPVEGNDKLSFAHPPIASQADWEAMLEKAWAAVETLAGLVELLPDEKLLEPFYDEKYGNYYRNLAGFIEHTHYHLGQMVLVKKLVLAVG
jgi:hypothetical protein